MQINRAKRLAMSTTARSTGVVLGGNLLNAAIGFAAMMLISRVLAEDRFGLFSVALAVMTVSTGLADLGIGTGLVRFASRALDKDREQADIVFKAAYRVEVAISLLVVVIGWLIAPTVAAFLGKGTELVLPIRLGFIGAGAMSMLSFVTAVFQSWQQFAALSAVNIFGNIFKITAIIWLWQSAKLQEIPALAVYAAAPALALVIGFAIMPRDWMNRPTTPQINQAYRQLFAFNKWLTVSYLINSLITRIDVFVLARTKELAVVGIYSLGFQLAQIFPILIGSIVTVLLPQVSRMSTGEEFSRFFRKSLVISALFLVALVPMIIIIDPVIKTLLPAYVDSIGIFRLLFAGFAINIIFNPLSTVLLAKDRPQLITVTNAIQLIVAIAANIILVPVYGAYGAAYAFIIWTAVGAIVIGVMLFGVQTTADRRPPTAAT